MIVTLVYCNIVNNDYQKNSIALYTFIAKKPFVQSLGISFKSFIISFIKKPSVQPGDQIFVKDYEFLSLAKNMRKNIDKNISENLSDKFSLKYFHFLIMLNNLQQIHLKLLIKQQLEKQQKQLVI